MQMYTYQEPEINYVIFPGYIGIYVNHPLYLYITMDPQHGFQLGLSCSQYQITICHLKYCQSLISLSTQVLYQLFLSYFINYFKGTLSTITQVLNQLLHRYPSNIYIMACISQIYPPHLNIIIYTYKQSCHHCRVRYKRRDHARKSSLLYPNQQISQNLMCPPSSHLFLCLHYLNLKIRHEMSNV